MPPSSEGYEKPTSQSTRKKSDKEPGGQPGHKGHNLPKRAKATETIDHPPAACRDCPIRTNLTNVGCKHS